MHTHEDLKYDGEILKGYEFESYGIGTPYIYFELEDSRTYFTGSNEEIDVSENDSHEIVAEFSTSTPAQYINQGNENSNNKSTGKFSYKLHGFEVDYYRENKINFPPQSVQTSYYQGDVFDIIISNDARDTMKSNAYHRTLAPYKYYLEIYNDYEAIGMEHLEQEADFLYAKPIPENNTTLYVFEFKQQRMRENYMTLTVRVRPDAEVSNRKLPVLKNAGIDMTGFKDKYSNPEEYPYVTFNYDNISKKDDKFKFPSEWGVEDNGYQTRTGLKEDDYRNEFIISSAILGDVSIYPYINGLPQTKQAKFKDHEKEKISFQAFIGNQTNSSAKWYDVYFHLPDEIESTTGREEDKIVEHKNQFNLNLSGPLTFIKDIPESYEITYYADKELEIPLDDDIANSNPEKIRVIKLRINNFKPKDKIGCQVLLKTDYNKTETVQDIYSYIGIETDSSLRNDITPLPAVPIAFESYSMSANVGWDKYETGKISDSLHYGIAKYSVYSSDGKEVYSSISSTSDTFSVNADASYVKVEIQDEYKNAYGITKVNPKNLPSDMDSNVDANGEKAIDINDLIQQNNNRYDAGLFKKHKVSDYAYNIDIGQTVHYENPEVYLVADNSKPIAIDKYTYDYDLSTINHDIVSIDSDSKEITGKSDGETYYKVTVTNNLGYAESAIHTITVGNPMKIKKVPDLDFGLVKIPVINTRYRLNSPAQLIVDGSKSYMTKNKAEVTVTLSDLLSANGNIIPAEAISYYKDSSHSYTLESPVTVWDYTEPNNIVWTSKSESGFYVEVAPGEVTDTNYNGTATWTMIKDSPKE